jgi:hypothetical protein
MSIIIRRYIDHMKLAVYTTVSFITLVHTFIFYLVSLYIWLCVLCTLFNFVSYVFYCFVYVFLLLYMLRSRYCFSLCRSVYCFVLYYCQRVPSQLQVTNISHRICHFLQLLNVHKVNVVRSNAVHPVESLVAEPRSFEHDMTLKSWKEINRQVVFKSLLNWFKQEVGYTVLWYMTY